MKTKSIDKNAQLKNNFEKWFRDNESTDDVSHDIYHARRVAQLSQLFASQVDMHVKTDVLLAASYFHDIVTFPKNDTRRSQSSKFAAIRAQEILRALNFPEDKLTLVAHAIEAHSFSANIQPTTIEAKILQDADRFEALGALGVARAFYVAGLMGSLPYDESDPLATNRELDDKKYALDHFPIKLFKLNNMQTEPSRQLAKQRGRFLVFFRNKLASEVLLKNFESACFITSTFHLAGQKKIRLFNENDVFAENRSLFFNEYALDNLLSNSSNSWFLSQLKKEL